MGIVPKPLINCRPIAYRSGTTSRLGLAQVLWSITRGGWRRLREIRVTALIINVIEKVRKFWRKALTHPPTPPKKSLFSSFRRVFPYFLREVKVVKARGKKSKCPRRSTEGQLKAFKGKNLGYVNNGHFEANRPSLLNHHPRTQLTSSRALWKVAVFLRHFQSWNCCDICDDQIKNMPDNTCFAARSVGPSVAQSRANTFCAS